MLGFLAHLIWQRMLAPLATALVFALVLGLALPALFVVTFLALAVVFALSPLLVAFALLRNLARAS